MALQRTNAQGKPALPEDELRALCHSSRQQRFRNYRGVTKMANSDQQHHDLTKNFLGKDYYVIVTTPVVPREELDKLLGEHLAHQIKLEKQGIMFGAGPLAGEDGARVGGMIIIRASSFAEARAIADSDPYHRNGLRTYTLTRWTVNEGSYTVRVNYSDQTMTIE
jgi:uncharacterized protein YciI